MKPCGGRSQKTGKRVGTRHRWDIGDCCIWCGRFKEDMIDKVSGRRAAERSSPIQAQADTQAHSKGSGYHPKAKNPCGKS